MPKIFLYGALAVVIVYVVLYVFGFTLGATGAFIG